MYNILCDFMKLINTYEYSIKKSKFIAYFYEVEKIDEVKDIMECLKKEHKKARHIPYAYFLDNTAGKSDDKEPSGTAGLPIYNILESNKCKNSLIAVVRYFGGIKLGAGGLLRAYKTAAAEVLKRKEL